MRVMVTGGAGYIGSHAVRLLLERGHEVTVVDNLVYGHRAAVPAANLHVFDMGNFGRLEKKFSRTKIDAVIHFAAFAYVGESVTDPEKYYRNNLAKTLTLLEVMRKCEVNKIVFSSTCATYGIPAQSPILESTPQAPINPYGRTKLAVEWALSDYARAYGLRFAALRYFNAAGAHPSGEIGEDHDPETHLLPLLMQTALGQRPSVKVFGTDYPTPDGTCIRDYVHVCDLAEAHLQALTALDQEPVIRCNLGTGHGYSVREAIASVEKISGRSVAVEEAPRREGDPPALVADASQASSLLGWTPKFRQLDDIVQTAWQWHSTHPDGYGDRKQ